MNKKSSFNFDKQDRLENNGRIGYLERNGVYQDANKLSTTVCWRRHSYQIHLSLDDGDALVERI